MKPYGKDHRHGPRLEGHQNCAICNEVKPPNKKRARRLAKKDTEKVVKEILDLLDNDRVVDLI